MQIIRANYIATKDSRARSAITTTNDLTKTSNPSQQMNNNKQNKRTNTEGVWRNFALTQNHHHHLAPCPLSLSCLRSGTKCAPQCLDNPLVSIGYFRERICCLRSYNRLRAVVLTTGQRKQEMNQAALLHQRSPQARSSLYRHYLVIFVVVGKSEVGRAASLLTASGAAISVTLQ